MVDASSAAPDLFGEEAGPRDGEEKFAEGEGEGAPPVEVELPPDHVEGEDGQAPAAPEGDEGAEDGTETGPVKFAGQEFESLQAAEIEFKRALGRLKAQGKQLSEAQSAARTAVDVALAWQRQYGGDGQPPAGPGGLSDGSAAGEGPADGTADTPGPDLTKFADGVDWGRVNEIAEEYGSNVALNYTVRKLARASQDYVQRAVEQATAPFRGMHENLQAASEAQALFTSASEAKGFDDSPLYPELGVGEDGEPANADAISKVVELFKRVAADFPGGPKTQLLHFAVLEYRRLYGSDPGVGVTPTNPRRPSAPPRGAGVGAQVLRALQTQAGAAVGAAGSSGPGQPLRRARGPVSAADEFGADIERVKSRVHPVFNVSR